jgi:hypothetical protein
MLSLTLALGPSPLLWMAPMLALALLPALLQLQLMWMLLYLPPNRRPPPLQQWDLHLHHCLPRRLQPQCHLLALLLHLLLLLLLPGATTVTTAAILAQLQPAAKGPHHAAHAAGQVTVVHLYHTQQCQAGWQSHAHPLGAGQLLQSILRAACLPEGTYRQVLLCLCVLQSRAVADLHRIGQCGDMTAAPSRKNDDHLLQQVGPWLLVQPNALKGKLWC